ncbi:hypothetical protein Pfo_020385 [Paulownia fortunei]|nr:hypothetical protein Pfo_020385 [Paulownia fortunei]
MKKESPYGIRKLTKMVGDKKEKRTDGNARIMRFKSWPFYHTWCKIFRVDRETGEGVEDCQAAAIDLLDTWRSKESTPQTGGSNAHYDIYENKTEMMLVFVDMITTFVDKQDSRLGDITKWIGYEYDASKARKAIFDALGEVPSVNLTHKIYVATLLVNNTKDLDLFFSMPTEARVEMVRIKIAGQI